MNLAHVSQSLLEPKAALDALPASQRARMKWSVGQIARAARKLGKGLMPPAKIDRVGEEIRPLLEEMMSEVPALARASASRAMIDDVRGHVVKALPKDPSAIDAWDDVAACVAALEELSDEVSAVATPEIAAAANRGTTCLLALLVAIHDERPETTINNLLSTAWLGFRRAATALERRGVQVWPQLPEAERRAAAWRALEGMRRTGWSPLERKVLREARMKAWRPRV